ncbi:4525_t:CDS:10 [Funneliformis caledonium]|uniref:4525_t:CDS:1 n=1 Tax=Funneliformis caledonium TaxID=1117310 RepID=A0A9N9HMH4_9GLOM|nr:4525_t:CDS:10 [Funneliformis caledonium]
MASQSIPTPIDSLQQTLSSILDLNEFPMSVRDLAIIWIPAANVWKRDLQRLLGLITVVIPSDRFVATNSFQKLIFVNAITLDISSGISSYFSNTEFEAWGYMGCLEHLAKVCVHLTSEDQDEILGKYRNHLRSISSSTSTLKRAKDKASKLYDTAERSFQRVEVTSFFKRIDTQVDTNATEGLSKLKARAYDRYIENTDEDDRSSKRPRQETIISEEDKKQPDANTIPKADDDNFDERKDDKDTERVEEESHSSNYVMDVFSESCSRQQTSSDSFLLPLLENYRAKETTSLYNPAHSFIIDLSPTSKIKGEFNDKQWTELVGRRPDAVRKIYHHEIEPIISHLFGQKADLSQARKRWYELRNLATPKYDDSFSYAEVGWEKIKRWVERVTGQFLDAFESLRNPLQNDCHEREWTGDYIIPLIQGALKLDGSYVPWGEISVLATQRRRNNDKDILTEQVERSHQVDLLCNYEQYEVACALACGGPYTYDLTKLASDEFNLPRIMKDMLDDLELKLLYAGKNGLHPYILGIQTYMTEVRVYLMEKRESSMEHSDNKKTQRTPPKQPKKKKA